MTLETLELQLGAMEPDGRGGTPNRCYPLEDNWLCFKVVAHGRFLLEEDHINLLSVKLTCRSMVAEVYV